MSREVREFPGLTGKQNSPGPGLFERVSRQALQALTTTPANVHDITVADQLLHGEEDHVIGDAGYTGIEKREEHQEREVDWMTAARLGQRKKMAEDSLELWMETITAQIRAKVEHSFFYIKRMFGYSKVRYRGLAKNTNRLYMLCAFANVMRMKSLLA